MMAAGKFLMFADLRSRLVAQLAAVDAAEVAFTRLREAFGEMADCSASAPRQREVAIAGSAVPAGRSSPATRQRAGTGTARRRTCACGRPAELRRGGSGPWPKRCSNCTKAARREQTAAWAASKAARDDEAWAHKARALEELHQREMSNGETTA